GWATFFCLDRDSRGHLLRLLRRPREGDPWRCSSVDILAREIPGGFLRCSYVGRCSSVDILAREILGGFLRCSSVGRCSSVDILAREIPRLAVQILLGVGMLLEGIFGAAVGSTASVLNLGKYAAFFEAHPNYLKNEFYVTGESYAGHYIPALAERIHRGNKEK
ncbi:hypothetical protein Taro_049545, partial [Colocasia esculenta]|nr:hypothetical protein [Colocasia esculenta]